MCVCVRVCVCVCVCVCVVVICFLLFCFGATARFEQYDSISSCSRKNARCSDCDSVRYLRLERERIAGYMGENDEEKAHVCCCCCWKKQNFHCFLLLIRDYGFVCFCFCLPSFFLLFFTSSVPQNWKAIPNVWHKPYRNLISFLRPVLVAAAAATTITAGTFSCRRWMS